MAPTKLNKDEFLVLGSEGQTLISAEQLSGTSDAIRVYINIWNLLIIL
jgi:hypothetical protein